MSASIAGYNVTLSEESPVFSYSPFRDGDPTKGWNSSYTGDSLYPANARFGAGTAYRKTQYDGASVTLSFEGIAIYLCLTLGGSDYSLTVDGQAYNTTASGSDPACSSYGASSLVFADGLDYKVHTAELTTSLPASVSTPFEFYGAVVTISAGSAGSTYPSTPTYLDDSNPKWSWFPSLGPPQWTVDTTQPGDLNNTRTFTCQYNSGSQASYTFTNVSVAMLLGAVGNDNFGYTIDFGGASYTYNGTNFWESGRQVLFFAGGLDPNSTYTISAINYDANQPDGAGLNNCFNIDALAFLTSTRPPLIPPSCDTNAGAIAGGVVGGVVGLALVVGLVWFFHRRRRASALTRSTIPLTLEDAPSPIVPYPARQDFQISYRSEKSGTGSIARPAMIQRQPSNGASTTPVDGTSSTSSQRPLSNETEDRIIDIRTLQGANTVDLVIVLNDRLRRDQLDNIEDPPLYETE